ncbi:capsule biosynthesis protein [Planktotalea arctica]|uniref:capsule biosynthesis protein n=2 Tax=Planktotalea arctica TaxID=1481893 RepID=UPI00321AD337
MALAENITVLKAGPGSSHAFAPPVRSARLRSRHIAAAVSFAVMVLLPVIVSAVYLWTRASDQYASTFAFSIRSEEASSGIELLGGIADLSGSGANDSDILYDYLRSQHLVEKMQTSLDLANLWSLPERDPIFAFEKTGLIEDLHKHWDRMIDISHDSTRGIIEVRARAFSPEDARLINEEILDHSGELINQINNIAHEDAVRYALDDLQRTKARLSQARTALTEFRVLNEMVDPGVNISTQTSLVATLEAQLTETLIEIAMLSANTRRSDTRLSQAIQRQNVLQSRIDQERSKRTIGTGEAGKQGMARLFGEYEKLIVEVEFTEQSYQIARAGFDAAISDARRNTRYLAAHILPTKADKSLFPKRGLILSFIALGTFLLWALISLVGFSSLDRR